MKSLDIRIIIDVSKCSYFSNRSLQLTGNLRLKNNNIRTVLGKLTIFGFGKIPPFCLLGVTFLELLRDFQRMINDKIFR